MARKTLEAWINEAMHDSDKDGPVTQMSLMHMVGQQQREVHVTKFGNKVFPARDLSKMFQGKADTYAQDLPGVQTFNLFVFYGGRNQPEATFIFVTNGQLGHGEGGLTTEGPTVEGRMQQSMRHGEMLIQQTYRRQQAQDDYTIRLLDVQNRMLHETMNENREMFTVLKDAMVQLANNNHESKMKELEYMRSSDERRKILQFLPPLVNTVLGREVFPQNTEDTAIIESLVENLKSEDVEKLAAVIPPQMLGPLMGRVERVMRDKALQEENDKRLSKSLAKSTPEAELEISVSNGKAS